MRRFLALALVAGLLVSVACGDDDDASENPGSDSGSDTTAEAGDPATQAPRPSPTPASEDGTVLTVADDDGRIRLTLSRIRELATAKVEGFDEEGVTLEALATEVGFSGDTTVTFRGYRENARTHQFALGQYSEMAPNTILYLNGEGQLALKSGVLEEAAWLSVVDQVIFE